MKRFFSKDQILTIPNLLSVIRIALIPVFIWLYVFEENYTASIGVILLSGATDIIDGWMARRFGMVSDFGKALDPLADKLTQATLLLCLLSNHKLLWGLIVIFVVCELVKFGLGIAVAQKHDEVIGAKWYGKANTVVIYTIMMLLILFPEMNPILSNTLICICAVSIVIAHALYFRLCGNILRKRSNASSKKNRG